MQADRSSDFLLQKSLGGRGSEASFLVKDGNLIQQLKVRSKNDIMCPGKSQCLCFSAVTSNLSGSKESLHTVSNQDVLFNTAGNIIIRPDLS